MPPSSSPSSIKEATKSLASGLHETNSKVSSFTKELNRHLNSNDFTADSDGLDFLEVKNSMMISYLVDLNRLTQLQIQLKLQSSQKPGKKNSNIRNNPEIVSCLSRLNEMRVACDKIRPMEKKLRYQIDKLLSLSDADNLTEDGKTVSSTVDETNPLFFRPNLDAMVAKDDDDEEEDDEENVTNDGNASDGSESSDDDDEDLKAAKEAARMSRSSKRDSQKEKDGPAGIYKAPRLTAVQYQEKERNEEKETRIAKKQQERMRRSELLQTMRSQFGENPEEEDIDGGASVGKQKDAARKVAERDAERTRFEEDTMVRLTMSRKDKKEKNRIMQDETSNLRSISDLGNLASGIAAFENSGAASRRRESFQRDGDFGGDDDESRHANGKRRRRGDIGGDSTPRRAARKHSNPLQSALYGTDGGSAKTSSKKKKKR